jgi:hypothetical protein
MDWCAGRFPARYVVVSARRHTTDISTAAPATRRKYGISGIPHTSGPINCHVKESMTKIAAINKAAIYWCSQWLVYLIRTADCRGLYQREGGRR